MHIFRALVFASTIALGHGQAHAFTCSSSEVIDTVKQIDAESKDWKNFPLVTNLMMQVPYENLKMHTEVSRIASSDDGCRATIAHHWTDLEGTEQSTEAIVLYTFNPTDDGKDVYVKIIDFERAYDFEKMMSILVSQVKARNAAK